MIIGYNLWRREKLIPKENDMTIINRHRRITTTMSLGLGILISSAFAAPSTAADYLGADAVLSQALQTNTTSKSKDEKTSGPAQLRADLKAFRQASATLPPSEFANQWLGLA